MGPRPITLIYDDSEVFQRLIERTKACVATGFPLKHIVVHPQFLQYICDEANREGFLDGCRVYIQVCGYAVRTSTAVQIGHAYYKSVDSV